MLTSFSLCFRPLVFDANMDESPTDPLLGVRDSSRTDIELLLGSLGAPAQAALVMALSRHLEESEGAKARGQDWWWKPREACLTALCAAIPRLLGIEDVEELAMIEFDFDAFASSAVLADLSGASGPLCQARAAMVTPQLCRLEQIGKMKPETSNSLCAASLKLLDPSTAASETVVLAATDAWESICDVRNEDILPMLGDVLAHVCSWSEKWSSTMLVVAVDCMRGCLNVDPDFTANAAPQIGALVWKLRC